MTIYPIGKKEQDFLAMINLTNEKQAEYLTAICKRIKELASSGKSEDDISNSISELKLPIDPHIEIMKNLENIMVTGKYKLTIKPS